MAGMKESLEHITPRNKSSTRKWQALSVLSAHWPEWLHGLNQPLGARKCYHAMCLEGKELEIFNEQYSLLSFF